MALSGKTREDLAARRYVMEILAGLVPSDPDFAKIWDAMPSWVSLPTAPASSYVDLAAKIREIRNLRAEASANIREG